MKEPEQFIAGKHAVLESLCFEGRVQEIWFNAASSKGLLEIQNKARRQNIKINKTNIEKLDSLYSGKHQGIVALTKGFEYSDLESVFARAKEKDKGVFVVILDHVQDPANLGAIIRSACVCGADGVIIPKDRGARVTPAVMKVAAGGCEHIPIVMVNNLTRTIEELQGQEFWIYAADASGDEIFDVEFAGNVAVVIGSEGKGLGRLVKERSDFLIKIPMPGVPLTFNASVAAGIILTEVARQRSVLKI